MSKFKIKVTLTETKTYSYEIDAPKQCKAEDEACDRAITAFINSCDHTTDDDVEIETEQQTKQCEECGTEYEIQTPDRSEAPGAWHEDDDWCAKCGAKIEAEDRATREVKK
jgi:hypothetical protein